MDNAQPQEQQPEDFGPRNDQDWRYWIQRSAIALDTALTIMQKEGQFGIHIYKLKQCQLTINSALELPAAQQDK